MKGDVAWQQAVSQVAAVQFRHDRLQGVLRSTDDCAGRCVLAGDLHRTETILLIRVQGSKQLLHTRPVHADGQHAAGPCLALLEGRAMVHQPCGICQRERTAGIGGGHFAGTVTHHAVRIDAPCLEQLHKCALQHENCGLGQLALVQFGLGGREAGVFQREICVLAPMILYGIHGSAEHRMCIVEGAAASCPLRALPGKHHGKAPLASCHGADRAGVFGKCVQGMKQVVPAVSCKGGARVEVRAAPTQVGGHRMEIQVLLFNRVPQLLGTPLQGLGCPRRQGN